MARDHALMYVLSAIIALNIIAIVLLSNRLADQETVPPGAPRAGPGNGVPVEAPRQPVRPDRPDVRTLILPAQCDGCFDVSEYLIALNDTIDMQVQTASAAAAPGFSDRLPAIAFNESLESYPTLVTNWEPTGRIVTIADGEYAGTWYVLPTQNAPYVENGTVRGLVRVTLLGMRSCGECYDLDVLRDSLNSTRITYTERIVDAESAEGRRIIAQYNITAVPTLIMDDEARFYPLRPGWDVVGTVEEDGSYVLRDLQRMNVAYYDLSFKRLMKP